MEEHEKKGGETENELIFRFFPFLHICELLLFAADLVHDCARCIDNPTDLAFLFLGQPFGEKWAVGMQERLDHLLDLRHVGFVDFDNVIERNEFEYELNVRILGCRCWPGN